MQILLGEHAIFYNFRILKKIKEKNDKILFLVFFEF